MMTKELSLTMKSHQNWGAPCDMCSEEVHRNVLTIYVVLNKTPYTLRHPVGVEIGIVLYLVE